MTPNHTDQARWNNFIKYLEYGKNADLIAVFKDAIVEVNEPLRQVFVLVHAPYELHQYVMTYETTARLEHGFSECAGKIYSFDITHAC